MKKNKRYLYLLLFLMASSANANSHDCIYAASHCFKINPLIIKAIIWQESKNKQNTVNFNKNNTQDIGIMQINSIHFNSLKNRGISEKELRENSCVNIFSGSWILNQQIQSSDYSWEGIGRYHSKTPFYRDRYVSKLISIILDENKTIDKIKVSYQPGILERFSCST